MSGWWSEVNKPDAANPPKLPLTVPKGNWWGEVSGGESMGPAEPLPENVEENPAMMAPIGRQAAGSLPTDETAKVRYLATQRFPGLTPEKAMDRYFYKDNRLAYKADDGKAYYEDPKLRLPTSAADVSQDVKAIATGAGPALPMIGGTAGGLLAIPEGPIGIFSGAGQAAAGGAVGDVVRQGLAAKITGEKKPLLDRALQAGGAAVEQGIGQIFGNSFAKGLSFLGKTPTYDIPETSALRDASEKFKIPLTPGEETGNRTLLRRQKVLANSTEGEQPFTSFYEGRNDSVRSAVDDMLNKLSPQKSPRLGAAAGVEGAQAALKESQKELSGLVGPAYKAAIDENPQRFWTPEVETLFGRPSMQKAIAAAKNLAAEDGRTITVPTFENGKRVGDEIAPDWVSWDYIKKAIDGIIEDNTNEFGRVSQYGRSVINTQKTLLGILDKANPKYPEARGIFKTGVPARAALEKGVVGDVAGLEGNDVLKAGSIIFGKGSSPEDVTLAREAFKKAGKEEAWDALARSHLEQIFNEIPDSATGAIPNIGGTFRKAIMGNERKRQIMEATFAHRPDFWSDVVDLSKVLDATGRAMKGESITAFAQAGQKELQKEGGGLGPKVLETVELWRTPSRLAQYWSDLNTSKYAARQAELFTTPEGRATLKELKQLGPGSAGAIIALSHFLTSGASAEASDALEPVKNGPAVEKRAIGGGQR